MILKKWPKPLAQDLICGQVEGLNGPPDCVPFGLLPLAPRFQAKQKAR
jgi:hypothetical protein